MRYTLVTKSKRVFVDTSGWIELLLKRELHHQQVADFFIKELEAGSKFFTNDYVLDEAWTRLVTHQSFSSAKALRDKTAEAQKNRQLAILWTDEILFNKAWQNFEKFREHRLSFTDAIIATITRDLKIDEILTLDEGFKKIGFVIRPLIR